ncbi:MAG: outer membrane beta-barrel protein [Proteobacteria bacterium]|nr:outer membrane beta-barrel protein [Pseudomonadota bacterium]
MKKFLVLFFLVFSLPALAFSPPPEGAPANDLWGISKYAGFDFGIGLAKSDKGFANTDKRMNAVGGRIGASYGYKFPFVRIGAEAGGAGASQEFQTDLSRPNNDKFSFKAFYLMPHIFLEMDWPGYVVPYVGYAIGIGALSTKNEHYVMTSVWPPVTEQIRDSKIGIGKTSAIMLGARFSLTSWMYWNVFWREQNYGRIRISKDNSNLISREIAAGLVLKF